MRLTRTFWLQGHCSRPVQPPGRSQVHGRRSRSLVWDPRTRQYVVHPGRRDRDAALAGLHEDPRGWDGRGRVGDSPTASIREAAMATYRSVCLLCSVVLKQTKHILARPPQTTTGCSARAYHRLHRPAGGSANERSPHFCFAPSRSIHIGAYVTYGGLDPGTIKTTFPLVTPRPSTDPGRRLVATVLLRERRRSGIHNVRST